MSNRMNKEAESKFKAYTRAIEIIGNDVINDKRAFIVKLAQHYPEVLVALVDGVASRDDVSANTSASCTVSAESVVHNDSISRDIQFIADAIWQNDRLQAVKMVRKLTSLDLQDAVDVVNVVQNRAADGLPYKLHKNVLAKQNKHVSPQVLAIASAILAKM